MIRGFSVFEFLTPSPGHRRLSMSIRNGKVGLALCEKNYLKVTIICRYIFLRFWDFVHFAVIKFCYFEYTIYTMSLYRIAIIIDNIILQASNSEKANQLARSL